MYHPVFISADGVEHCSCGGTYDWDSTLWDDEIYSLCDVRKCTRCGYEYLVPIVEFRGESNV